jgi:P-type Ca2+ transporter type 2C
VNVIRDGEECIVKNVDIVVGDILKLEAGNAVVADGFFVSGFKLKANESSVTGESEPVLKTPAEPYLISGSYVIEGTGTMLVTAVGESSFYGQTLEDIMGEAAETGLQVKLGYLAAAVGKVGASVAFACFCVLLIIWFAKYPGSYADNATDILEFFLYAVTIVVVAVPEGLPLAVTISLAYSMRKMLADKIFVRVMASCETMGGATAICSDKTGTLTENQMTIVEGMFAGEVYGASSGAPQGSDLHPENAMLFSDNAILNSECFKTHDEATGKAIFAGGNATEQAFLILTDAWGLDYHGVRSQKEVHRKYIFSSATKMSHVVVVMDQGYRMHTKGAWDWVLKACQRMRMPDGSEVEMNGEKVTMVTEQATQMARRGLRCLALCYTDLPSTCSDDDFEEPPLQMGTTVLVALVGIKDPVRKEVRLRREV